MSDLTLYLQIIRVLFVFNILQIDIFLVVPFRLGLTFPDPPEKTF